MDLLSRADLESLTESHSAEHQLSLFMPTHRFGSGVEADQITWKNLVNAVEVVLAEQLRRPDVEQLLAPARELQQDSLTWRYMSDGLVMFVRPGWHKTFRVAARLPEFAAVGNHLVLGPLLRLLSGDGHFLLLALSQREVRLMEGSRNTVEEVELGDVPTSLGDVVRPREPRSDTMARPGTRASRGGPAVFYGHGAADEHFKTEEVLRFLRQVSTGLREVLSGETSPMVLVGLDHLVGAYREVDAYPHTTETAVIRNPDSLSAAKLHELAWPIVEQRLREARGAVVEVFRELHGTGRVSSNPEKVREAAAHGRVETLFVKADPWCWERVKGSEPAVVQLGAHDEYCECEGIDATAVDTLNGGGLIYAMSQAVVPDSDVAAVFRY